LSAIVTGATEYPPFQLDNVYLW